MTLKDSNNLVEYCVLPLELWVHLLQSLPSHFILVLQIIFRLLDQSELLLRFKVFSDLSLELGHLLGKLAVPLNVISVSLL